MQSNQQLHRRRLLQGVGACLALPTFESFANPRRGQALAAAVDPRATTSSGAPLRLGFVYFPNGAQQARWWPRGNPDQYNLNTTMAPLQPWQDQLQVIAGLDHLNAEAGPDGGGDHARANATFLTGVRARKTSGTNIRLGVSIDQLAAQRAGELTRFPSLELTCDAVRKSGPCDTGYSCAYQYNLSWQSETTPMTPEANPRLLFERLFGSSEKDGTSSYQVRQAKQKSILDFVLDDVGSLQRELGQHDQRKLDEYLGSVREVERQLARSESFGERPRTTMAAPQGVPSDYGQHIELMFDLLALAYQTDSTRIATLLMAHDGSNRAFPELGIPEGHHYLTHNQEQEEPCEKVGRIDRFYMEHFARFVARLSEMEDADGTSVLHNSMIVYGSGNADGDRHTHTNLPVILAGAGGGRLQPGRYVTLASQPMSNLYLGLLDRFGIHDVENFGDSTGCLADV